MSRPTNICRLPRAWVGRRVKLALRDRCVSSRNFVDEDADSFGGEVGISAWNGFAIARFCAQDATRLRADMMKVLARVSPSGLPRLWLN